MPKSKVRPESEARPRLQWNTGIKPVITAASTGPAAAAAAAGVTANVAPVPSINLTLRRAESVPLGLEVRGDSGASFLIVVVVARWCHRGVEPSILG